MLHRVCLVRCVRILISGLFHPRAEVVHLHRSPGCRTADLRDVLHSVTPYGRMLVFPIVGESKKGMVNAPPWHSVTSEHHRG